VPLWSWTTKDNDDLVYGNLDNGRLLSTLQDEKVERRVAMRAKKMEEAVFEDARMIFLNGETSSTPSYTFPAGILQSVSDLVRLRNVTSFAVWTSTLTSFSAILAKVSLLGCTLCHRF